MRRTTATIINEIERRVIADKFSAKFAEMLFEPALKVLKEFSGQKAVKVDGTLTKKLENALPKPLNRDLELKEGDVVARPHRVYVTNRYGWIILRADVSVKFGQNINFRGELDTSDFIYNDLEIYLAKIDSENKIVFNEQIIADSVLKLVNIKNTDYNKIKSIRSEIIELEKQINELKSDIPHYARNLSHYSKP